MDTGIGKKAATLKNFTEYRPLGKRQENGQEGDEGSDENRNEQRRLVLEAKRDVVHLVSDKVSFVHQA